jgi:biotin carboxyl carrier protein
MKVDVRVNGSAARLNATEVEGQWLFSYARDGEPVFEGAASVVEVEPGLFSVVCGGRSYRARVAGTAVQLGTGVFEVETVDPREAAAGAWSARPGGRHQITSPMPGKVIRVLAAEGDMVAQGAGVVVVEAMKMQNELTSPAAGRVVSVTARENASVGAGEVLAIVEAG